MIDEEIKAYVSEIEKTPLNEVNNVLPSPDFYNVDIIMGKICELLNDNIKVLRDLNSESKDQELNEEINELLDKLSVCNNYLNDQNFAIHYNREVEHELVFAKTPTGKPYFMSDLDKVPKEKYDEVKKALNGMLYGVDKGNNTKFRYLTNNEHVKGILEFKAFQVRIFVTKLKDNVLCVLGLSIKKADNDKKTYENLGVRVSQVRKQIDDLKLAVSDVDKKQELLNDGKKILEDMELILGKDDELSNDDVELLFSSDEELEDVVAGSLDEVQEFEDSSKNITPVVKAEDIDNSLYNLSSIPSTSKKVKRRGRGLGKKTIARNAIMEMIKKFDVEELLEVQEFLQNLLEKKELNDSINNIYTGFVNMSDEQIKEFENNIKYFKYDGTEESNKSGPKL